MDNQMNEPKISNEDLLTQWEEAKRLSTEAVAKEKELRMKVASQIFDYDENKLQKGTQNYELPNKYKAKMVFKLNDTLDQKEVPKCKKWLRENGCPKQIVDKLFSVKYSLSKSTYKMLDKAQQEAVQCLWTQTPGTPSLEIVSP